MDAIIEAQNLYFSYNSSPVLEDISFSVHSGEFIGIIGPNGGGKTTLLRLMLGFLSPEKGFLRLCGEKPRQARAFVGYMPQYSNVNDAMPLTVEQIVAMGLFSDTDVFPRITGAKKRKIHELLEMVSLKELAAERFQDLSGGQRQRTLLARAIVSSPKILLLDEPTASVDHRVEKDIYDYLKTLSGSMTIFLVSHDIGTVSTLVDRVMCLNRKAVMHHAHEITGDDVGKALYHHDTGIITHSCGL